MTVTPKARCFVSRRKRKRSRSHYRCTSAACFPGPKCAALGDEIKKAQTAGDPDTGETYYHHWLNALERIVAAKGLADPQMLARTRNAWANACARTPHGTPIELRAGDFVDF